MSLTEIATFIGQVGIPSALALFLLWAYDRKERLHSAEREKWDDEYKKLNESRLAASDAYAERVLKMQEANIKIVSQASEIASIFERERREIREARERELREAHRDQQTTGPHHPVMGPWKGGRERG